jgi:RNA polymerase primary sigma factor
MEALAVDQERAGRLPEPGENEELAAAASRARVADRELATSLNRPAPARPTGRRGRQRIVCYLDDLGRRRPLSPEIERRLVAAAKEGDQQARAKLIDAYMPLIADAARLYRMSPVIGRIELVQEGVIGLLIALERCPLPRRARFWDCAEAWVRWAMRRLITELTRAAVLSDQALRQLARIRDAQIEAAAELGREPTISELAARTGLSPDHVATLLAVDEPPRSTKEVVRADDQRETTVEDMLVDATAEVDYERVLDAIEAQELTALLSVLSDRERMVLRARYGVDGEEEQSPTQVAERLGLSSDRVGQIERRALTKLAAAAGVKPAA